jgi:hypothetical protein
MSARDDELVALRPAEVREGHSAKELGLPTARYMPEQIVTLLRQMEVDVANGKTTLRACKEAEIALTVLASTPCPLALPIRH